MVGLWVWVDPSATVVGLSPMFDSVESDVQAVIPKGTNATNSITPPASANLLPTRANDTVPPLLVDTCSRSIGSATESARHTLSVSLDC